MKLVYPLPRQTPSKKGENKKTKKNNKLVETSHNHTRQKPRHTLFLTCKIKCTLQNSNYGLDFYCITILLCPFLEQKSFTICFIVNLLSISLLVYKIRKITWYSKFLSYFCLSIFIIWLLCQLILIPSTMTTCIYSNAIG